jgi:hypothetical protein
MEECVNLLLDDFGLMGAIVGCATADWCRSTSVDAEGKAKDGASNTGCKEGIPVGFDDGYELLFHCRGYSIRNMQVIG